MKKNAWVVLLVLLISVISPVFAQASIKDYEIKYYIEDSSVREVIRIELPSAPSSVNFTSGEVRDVSVRDRSGNLSYEIKKDNNFYYWTIFLKNDTNILISFYSDGMVFTGGDASQFFSELSLESYEKLAIYAYLPHGDTVVSFYPKYGVPITDGKRIGMIWEYRNSEILDIPVSVRFEKTKTDYVPYLGAVLLVFVIVSLIHYYRKRVHTEFMSGFLEDEKKVVKYLIRNRTSYQNIIEKEFKFSRAKMTRIVKKLEQRDLLKKERKGRTNRLTWKR